MLESTREILPRATSDDGVCWLDSGGKCQRCRNRRKQDTGRTRVEVGGLMQDPSHLLPGDFARTRTMTVGKVAKIV